VTQYAAPPPAPTVHRASTGTAAELRTVPALLISVTWNVGPETLFSAAVTITCGVVGGGGGGVGAELGDGDGGTDRAGDVGAGVAVALAPARAGASTAGVLEVPRCAEPRTLAVAPHPLAARPLAMRMVRRLAFTTVLPDAGRDGAFGDV